jgi:hypothetical protein
MDESTFNVESIQLENLTQDEYSLTLYALGYEKRATAMLDLVNPRSKRSVAIGFNFGNCLSFKRCLSIFQGKKIELREGVPDEEFEMQLQNIIEESLVVLDEDATYRALVDISCFNRYRLASILDLLRSVSKTRKVVIDFFYSVARYSEPSHLYVPNAVVSPVHRAFAGWATTPANPTAAIVGLGYEQDQALGIVEHLQANPVWLFSPVSGEKRYEPAVIEANELLLEELPAKHVVKYNVEQPADTFRLLDGMVRGLQHDHNIVMVPFGPKIFVLCALLTAWRHDSSAVWRVSPGAGIDPHDRQASRFQSILRVSARPNPKIEH